MKNEVFTDIELNMINDAKEATKDSYMAGIDCRICGGNHTVLVCKSPYTNSISLLCSQCAIRLDE